MDFKDKNDAPRHYRVNDWSIFFGLALVAGLVVWFYLSR